MLQPDQWTPAWRSLGASPPAGLFENLLARYSEPHRYYHTLQHLEECLTLLKSNVELASHPAEIELALWFHDAVYDTHAHDNEEQSARLAEESLTSAGVSPDATERIVNLILATKHAAIPTDSDAQLLVDIDLAILGTSADRFAQYEHQVRQEYHWVPPDAFNHARGQILTSFLARPSIYSTPMFQEHYESRARGNLQASIARLIPS